MTKLEREYVADLTDDEASVFHIIRKRADQFKGRLLRAAEKRGELPSERKRLWRALNAAWAGPKTEEAAKPAKRTKR